MGLSICFDDIPKGRRNLFTDVPGVLVGHATLSRGDVQTGVTAVLPHSGNIFQEKVPAAVHVINGFGKTAGSIQIQELGTLETPILLTNTLSVGDVSSALVRYMLEQNPDIGLTTGTVNPLVLECNDGELNDIRGQHVGEKEVRQALRCAAADFEEGAVGAGRGMVCCQMKGGIGSSSRVLCFGEKEYHVGALVLSNFGSLRDLVIAGRHVGPELAVSMDMEEDKGSIIVVLATDIPMSTRQLKRICKRASVGISRTGGHIGNGSGEIAAAFTTANRIPHYEKEDILPMAMLAEKNMNQVFRAVIGAVEEAVISSMFHAEPVTGRAGNFRDSLANWVRLDDFAPEAQR